METLRDWLIRNYGHKLSDAEIEEALDHQWDKGIWEEEDETTNKRRSNSICSK